MKKFEHLITDSHQERFSEEEHLKEMGKDGWRLASVVYSGEYQYYYWVRTMPNISPNPSTPDKGEEMSGFEKANVWKREYSSMRCGMDKAKEEALRHPTPTVEKSEGEEAKIIDWNNKPMEFYIEHLENKFKYDSSGTAKAVYELIQAFQQLSAATHSSEDRGRKEWPEEKQIGKHEDDYTVGVRHGWNDCLNKVRQMNQGKKSKS